MRELGGDKPKIDAFAGSGRTLGGGGGGPPQPPPWDRSVKANIPAVTPAVPARRIVKPFNGSANSVSDRIHPPPPPPLPLPPPLPRVTEKPARRPRKAFISFRCSRRWDSRNKSALERSRSRKPPTFRFVCGRNLTRGFSWFVFSRFC